MDPCPAPAPSPLPRRVEALHACPSGPCRPPDAYEPSLRDRVIPDRLPFALALLKSNLEARAARAEPTPPATQPPAPTSERPRMLVPPVPPAAAPTPPQPSLRSPRLGDPPPPTCPPPAPRVLRPPLRLIATRRGSILDVLA